MKRIALATVGLGAAVGAGYYTYPDEFLEYMGMAVKAARWAWDGVRANPVPVSVAAGTFLLTVIYHKAKGKSLRESVEVAATRVTVIAVPAKDAGVAENSVVRRAKARATRSQLLTDQIGLQNRQRKLPEEVQKAEKEACYSQQWLADAKRNLVEKQKSHDEAEAKLEAIRKEKAESAAELAEIDVELKKLAEMI